jgi:glutamate racemase
MNTAAIGVYDSGFGGLSVWRELRRLLPDESLVYLGDGKNCPYGGRSREEIIGFAEAAVKRLLSEGVKMVVVGCNTATTAAIDHLRERWPELPIVGLEPAVKPACLTTQSRKIAVLATEHSLRSDMFLRTASRYAEDVEVIKVVGRDFVEIVEENQEHSERAERAVRSVVEPLVGLGVDKIVLGCTHYPFLRPLIEQSVAGHGIEVIDSGEAVARRVKWLLERYEIAADTESVAELKFCTFADEGYRQRLESKALSIDSELRNESK